MEPSLAPAPIARWLNFLLGATALAAAWLLFQIQPLVAKRILPWFGGGTAVWTTAMIFFQSALFAGYAYAHWITRALTPGARVALHLALLTVAVAMLLINGVVPGQSWQPADANRPAARILMALAASVGLPYILLAATAPLTQVWFAAANPGRSPYRLYALSNLGSLAALVSYPLAVEPNLGVVQQGAVWSAAFACFAVACAGSGLLTIRLTAGHSEQGFAPAQSPGPTETRRRTGERFFWLALPACASVVLLAVTAHLCQDVAAIPLLWVAPLVVYLLTFIIAFGSDRWYRRDVWLPLLAVASFVAVHAWLHMGALSLAWQIGANLALLAAVGMMCHGEVARLRPAPSRLTAYYLALTAGGALGGILVGVVAPLVFADQYELHLGVLAAWLLALAVLVTDPASPFFDGRNFRWLAGAVALLAVLFASMINLVVQSRAQAVALARSFYGALKVREIVDVEPRYRHRQLTNGRVSHGVQFAEQPRIASQYYQPNSGVGLLLEPKPDAPAGARRIGVVGLGVGTLATYAIAGDAIRFYEIDSLVTTLAEEYFTFLADARARGVDVTIVSGDARLQLERESPQRFDALVLDAFTSDAIPMHLLTVEAFAEYLRHLAEPDGVLAVHLSNKHLDLSRVVAAAADRLGLEAQLVVSEPDGSPAGSAAAWMLVHRPGASVAERRLGAAAEESSGAHWTDDFNNLLDVLRAIEAP